MGIIKSMKTSDGLEFIISSYIGTFTHDDNYYQYDIYYPSTSILDFCINKLGAVLGEEKTIEFTCGNKLWYKYFVSRGEKWLNCKFYTIDNEPVFSGSYRYIPPFYNMYSAPYIVDDGDNNSLIGLYLLTSNEQIPVIVDKPGIYYQKGTHEYRMNEGIAASGPKVAEFLECMDKYNPDDPGGNSGEGGGAGTFDNTTDPVDFPNLPTLSAVSAGFVSLYAPTLNQMNSLSSYMWSDAFDLTNFKKLFADPMDVVIGLSIVPVDVPKGSTKEIRIGLVNTGVVMTQAASQYVTVDCGTIDVKEYWGSALDYSPYTKFSIYLPYIGTRDIKTDDIMGKTVQVKYNIDILSGSCTAMIKCGESVLYEYSGSCASSIPLTGNNWTSLVTAGIQLAGMGIAAAATGGASVAAAPTAATLGKAAGSAATYAAGNVSSMKPTVQRSGGVSGSAGMLGIQRPYLIAELPRQSLAKNYKSFVGYPSNITKKLSELSGYTEIEEVHLEDIPATTSELEEIHNLLVNGVIM